MGLDKAFTLVKKLYEKTLKDKDILWEETVDEGVYQTAFPDYTVQVSKSRDNYILNIFNEEGRLVKDMTGEELGQNHPESYKIMYELYQAARDIAMRAEEAIDSILSSL